MSCLRLPQAESSRTARSTELRRMPSLQREPGRGSLSNAGCDPEGGGLVHLSLQAHEQVALGPDERVPGQAQGLLLDRARVAGWAVEEEVRRALDPEPGPAVHRDLLDRGGRVD